MDAIVGHENMDFDCLASMVAASRLHPEAEIFLQPTSEGPVRDYLNLYREHFDFRRFKDFDPASLETLIVVEANNRDRLGPYAEGLDVADRVVLYDHHEPDEESFVVDESHLDESGALVTSMVEYLRDRNECFDEEEATLYLLALHQETGSFQFGSTTSRDYGMGQYLMEEGANLDVVQKYTHRPLSAVQINLFNDLLEKSRGFLINEVPVTLAVARRDEYIPEIALLTHKLQDTENADFIAVVVGLEDRVQLVLRNRHDHLDVGAIARRLGGGGHPRAASASFKERTIEQVEEELLKVLNQTLSARRTARDIMSTPVHSIRPEKTVHEASDLMIRLGYHGLPITDEDENLSGIVTRTDIDKAMNHDLGHAPVKGIMSPDVVTVEPEAGLERLRNILTNEQIGRLPVVEEGRLVGIVTRTDLIKALHREEDVHEFETDDVTSSSFRHAPDVTGQLEDAVTDDWLERFRRWGRHASEIGDTLYLVGGCVRDVLIGGDVQDVDFLLEDNAIEFARSLFEDSRAELAAHEKFQTVVVTLPNGEKVDFATARSEYYTHPSALPEVDVEHASVVQDLRRRDFTINAMAINLTAESFGTLIDLYGGYRDLRNGIIRILYAMSFVDDPTRIFRAVRFARRLDFDLEERTRQQLESAVDEAVFDDVSGERLRYELELIFREDDTYPILSELESLDVLAHIHESLELSSRLRSWLEEAHELIDCHEPADPELVYYCLLFESLDKEGARDVGERLNFPRDYRNVLTTNARFETVRNQLKTARKPSEIFRICEKVERYELLLARRVMDGGNIAQKIEDFLTKWSEVDPLVDGDRLADWGMEPGPKMGELLRDMFDYQLDHEVESARTLREQFRDRLPSPDGTEESRA